MIGIAGSHAHTSLKGGGQLSCNTLVCFPALLCWVRTVFCFVWFEMGLILLVIHLSHVTLYPTSWLDQRVLHVQHLISPIWVWLSLPLQLYQIALLLAVMFSFNGLLVLGWNCFPNPCIFTQPQCLSHMLCWSSWSTSINRRGSHWQCDRPLMAVHVTEMELTQSCWLCNTLL